MEIKQRFFKSLLVSQGRKIKQAFFFFSPWLYELENTGHSWHATWSISSSLQFLPQSGVTETGNFLLSGNRYYHRHILVVIIQSFSLEKTHKIRKSNHHLTLPSPPLKYVPSATSRHPSNASRNGNSTTSLGSLFLWLTSLSAKKFFLALHVNLSWHNCRLLFATWEKRPTPTSLQPPFLSCR